MTLYRTPVTKFDPCRVCGCTPEQPCPGGCRRDPRHHGRTYGLCSSCMSHPTALEQLGGSKKHNERRNTLSEAQIAELGGWRCVICTRPEEFDITVPGRDGPHDRVIRWYHHADERAVLGGVCVVYPAGNPVGVTGCRPALMRVARGNRFGSVRRLHAVKRHDETTPSLDLFPDITPTDADHRQVARLARDGIAVTAVQIASFRAETGHRCAVCHRHITSWPNRRPGDRNPLQLDHDHAGARIRGWVCAECNGAMQFIDLAPPAERDAYYQRALWLFRDAQGVTGEPWYRTPPWFHTLATA